MREYVSQGDTVIDLGCGGGYFAVALAKMVGDSGRVIAMDLQQEMLNITRDYAAKNGVLDRITLHRCQANDIALNNGKMDFALAFYMVHEVPDRKRFLTQIADLLKPTAHLMVIEPAHHVTATQFDQIVKETNSVGLKLIKPIKLAFSRGMLLRPTTNG